jgi:hypothetical protein
VVLLRGGDVPVLVNLELALAHEVLDDLRGALMLLDGILELGYLQLQLIELLQLLIDLELSLLVVELLLLDLGRCASPLGTDLEEIGADAFGH